MYSSWVGMRLASVSATPYIATANSAAAATNQATPVARISKSAPRSTAAAISTASWSALEEQRDDEVPRHDQRPWHGCREQVALGPAEPVDDDAEPGGHAAQRHQQAHGRHGAVGHVVDPADGAAQRVGERGHDDDREQGGVEEGDEQLARGARAEGEPPPGQGGEGGSPPGPAGRGRSRGGRSGGHGRRGGDGGGHGVPSLRVCDRRGRRRRRRRQRGEGLPGELQVHVVERRRAGDDRRSRHAQRGDGGGRLGRRLGAQGHVDAVADDERAVVGDVVCPQQRQRRGRVPGDPQLDDLAAEAGEQRAPACRGPRCARRGRSPRGRRAPRPRRGSASSAGSSCPSGHAGRRSGRAARDGPVDRGRPWARRGTARGARRSAPGRSPDGGAHRRCTRRRVGRRSVRGRTWPRGCRRGLGRSRRRGPTAGRGRRGSDAR